MIESTTSRASGAESAASAGSNSVTLTEPTDVRLGVAGEDIASITQIGDDLMIEMLNGNVVTIENFFAEGIVGAVESQIFLEGAVAPLTLTTSASGLVAAGGGLLGGLGGAALGIGVTAALASGLGDSDDLSPAQRALNLINAFDGTDATVAPTVADYEAAGVEGLTEGNLAALNEAVAASEDDDLSAEEIEEIEEMIALIDVDENDPVFTSGTTAQVVENTGAGQLVYTAQATDNVAVTGYSLSGTDAAAFSINGTTGEVTLTADPDFETKSSYNFTVTAEDAAGNTTEQQVTLSVTDVDENVITELQALLSSWDTMTQGAESEDFVLVGGQLLQVDTVSTVGETSFSVTDSLSANQIMLIAGGGGGGAAEYGAGGGGGAGELLLLTDVELAAQEYTFEIGAGGAGSTSLYVNGTNGADSSISASGGVIYEARGGGGGGAGNPNVGGTAGNIGGSAGGSSVGFSGTTGSQSGIGAVPYNTITGFGNAGGGSEKGNANNAYRVGGGGGGAGSAGETGYAGVIGTTRQAGDGGDGHLSDITGELTAYAAGGGGGARSGSAGAGGSSGLGGEGGLDAPGQAATGYGSGGGGAGSTSSSTIIGGDGYQGAAFIQWDTGADEAEVEQLLETIVQYDLEQANLANILNRIADASSEPDWEWTADNIQDAVFVPYAASGSTASYIERNPDVVLDSSIVIEAGNGTHLRCAKVSIVDGKAFGDSLSFEDTSNISGDYDGTAGVLTLQGLATIEEYQDALRSITYRSPSFNPTATGTTRTLEWSLEDTAGYLSEQVATTTLNITEVDEEQIVSAYQFHSIYAANWPIVISNLEEINAHNQAEGITDGDVDRLYVGVGTPEFIENTYIESEGIGYRDGIIRNLKTVHDALGDGMPAVEFVILQSPSYINDHDRAVSSVKAVIDAVQQDDFLVDHVSGLMIGSEPGYNNAPTDFLNLLQMLNTISEEVVEETPGMHATTFLNNADVDHYWAHLPSAELDPVRDNMTLTVQSSNWRNTSATYTEILERIEVEIDLGFTVASQVSGPEILHAGKRYRQYLPEEFEQHLYSRENGGTDFNHANFEGFNMYNYINYPLDVV